MKKFLAAMAAVLSIVTTTGWVVYASNQQGKADPSPVIHGSSDQTIAPTPFKPRHKLPGYPISRMPEGVSK